jgi:hypothetical protein
MIIRRLIVAYLYFTSGWCLVDAAPASPDEEATLLEELVLASAYLYTDQSLLELAVKDSSWERYDAIDTSSYWSTGKQGFKNFNASVVTYAHSTNTLFRRDFNDDVHSDGNN